MTIKVPCERVNESLLAHPLSANEIGISGQTINRYMRRKRYPLFVIKTLHRKVPGLVSDLQSLDVLFFYRWKEVRLPFVLTPKLAYFIRYMQGDGCCERNKKRIAFVDEYESQMLLMDDLCHELFGIRGIHRASQGALCTKPKHVLAVGSKALNEYFHHIFGFAQGRKHRLRILDLIEKHPALFPWYFAGLVDADGTLPKDPFHCRQHFVDFTSKDEEFIMRLRELLKAYEVHAYKPHCRVAKSPTTDTVSVTWDLQIRRHDAIRTFLRTFPLAHPDKRRRANELLALLGP